MKLEKDTRFTLRKCLLKFSKLRKISKKIEARFKFLVQILNQNNLIVRIKLKSWQLKSKNKSIKFITRMTSMIQRPYA